MPLSLSNATIEQFKMQFILEFQAVEKLRNTVTDIFGTRGDAYKLSQMGAVATTDRGAYQSLIEGSDQEVNQAEIVFSNYTLNLILDIFQEKTVIPGVLASLAQTHAKSCGRRCDQVLFDAMAAGKGSTVAVGTTNLTVDKLREAKATMDENNVTGDRYICVTPSQIDSLLAEESVTNVLYNNQRTLVDGDVGTFLGFKFLPPIGLYPEGGLKKDGDNRSVFCYSKEALTRAFQIAPTVTTDFSPQHQSWLTISRLRLGAVVNQPVGCVEILCDETK